MKLFEVTLEVVPGKKKADSYTETLAIVAECADDAIACAGVVAIERCATKKVQTKLVQVIFIMGVDRVY